MESIWISLDVISEEALGNLCEKNGVTFTREEDAYRIDADKTIKFYYLGQDMGAIDAQKQFR